MDVKYLCLCVLVSLGLATGVDIVPISRSNVTKLPPSRPGTNFTVTIEFSLRRIYELNHAQEYIDLDGWLHLYWVDHNLQWDPKGKKSEYTRISTGEIWVPDIILYNDFGAEKYKSDKADLAIVYNTGHVMWVPSRRFRSYCDVNLRNFPFDQQECSLTFGVWAYGANEVDLSGIDREGKPGVDLDNFIPGGEWDIIHSHYDRQVNDYGVASAPKAEVVYTMAFERSTEFYYNIFVVPAILVTFLVPFQFLLQLECRERVSFCLILIVTIVLLAISLSQYIAKGMRYVPRLIEFYIVSVGIITVSFIVSILLIHFYHRGGRKGRLPGFIRTIFLSGLNRLLLIDTPADFEEPEEPSEDEPEAIELESVKTEEPKKDEEGEKKEADKEGAEEKKEDAEEKAKPDEEAPEEPKEEPKPEPEPKPAEEPKAAKCEEKCRPKEKCRVDEHSSLMDLIREQLRLKNGERIQELIDNEWRLLVLMSDRILFLGFMALFVIYANAILS